MIEDSISVDEIYNDYVELMTLCHEHPDNYKYSPIRKELQDKCLRNPEIVYGLLVDSRSDRSDTFHFRERNITFHMRHELIFVLSKDDCRTCSVPSNPKWAKFMREFVIPLSFLDHGITDTIKWYIRVHGL
jgi:hypothetical protein